MPIPIFEIIKPSGKYGSMPYILKTGTDYAAHKQVTIEKGFFFLLVINGTASFTDTYRDYTVGKNDLLIFTPSVKAVIEGMSTDFSLACLYVQPDYFDSLSVGQLVYNQVSKIIGNNQLPVFQLEQGQADYLRQTLDLFSGQAENLRMYRDGAIHSLCAFLLLQLADAIYRNDRDASNYAKHSTEIFRNFKKLLVHHYREHHDIKFYADRLNISTTYLSRIVKNLTGRTVRFHVSKLLCADARKLLESTDLDVKEIADMLGFSDQSVFGKFFVRMMGVSPVKFRTKQ